MVYTFPRTSRLTRPAEFRSVFSGTQVNIASGRVRTRARKNDLCKARLGVVVPKKGTPKAVRRNRIKRIVRDRFRLTAAQLPPIDIVVQVFKDEDDPALVANLDKLFQQLADAAQLQQVSCSSAPAGTPAGHGAGQSRSDNN